MRPLRAGDKVKLEGRDGVYTLERVCIMTAPGYYAVTLQEKPFGKLYDEQCIIPIDDLSHVKHDLIDIISGLEFLVSRIAALEKESL